MSAGKSVQDLEEDLKERLEHMHRELAKARQRITELEVHVLEPLFEVLFEILDRLAGAHSISSSSA
jgi:CRISPR/Cas system CSM-associated protein Csm2 small subunit